MMEDVRAFSEASLGARYQAEDRWTSLLTGALEASAPEDQGAMEPLPTPPADDPGWRPPRAPALPAMPAVIEPPVPFPTERPPPKFVTIEARPVEQPPARDPPPPPVEQMPSVPPSSALERAIVKVAKDRALELGDGGAIWGDVVENLRERRPTARPEAPRASDGVPQSAQRLGGNQAASPSSAALESRRSAPTLSPASFGSARLARRRWRWSPTRRAGERTSGRWLGWGLAAAGAAGVAVASIVLVPRFLPGSPTRDGTAETAQPPPSLPATSNTSAPLPSASAQPSASGSAAEAPPPDASDLPPNMGYVLFASDRALHVYVNGHLVGETGQWLRIECEYRNVRFSDRTMPKIGSSFPAWTGEGHTVVVPCRSATRLTVPASASGVPEPVPR